MGGVGARFGHELRTRWPAMLGLALLIGVVAGVVMATAMGARRTATAYDRFLVDSRANDILMGSPPVGSPETDRILDEFAAAPDVVEAAVASYAIGLAPGELSPLQDPIAPLDARLLREIDRPNLLRGRLPDPARVDEILVNPAAAEAYAVDVGDELTLYGFSPEDYTTAPEPEPRSFGDAQRFTVTGIGVLANEVVPLAPLDSEPGVAVTPAYATLHPEDRFGYGYLRVRLAPGATDDDFDAVLDRALRAMDIDYRFVPVVRGSQRRLEVNRAIRPQAQALGAFAVLLGLAGIAVLGQLLTRHLLADTAERRQLWALGLTRRQLLGLAMARVGLVLAGAVVVALGVAVGLSSRFPIGPARQAEPHPGTALHGAGLGLGVLVTITVFLVVAALVVRRSLRDLGPARAGSGGRADRPDRLAIALARAGAPTPWVMGTHFALDRRSVASAGAGTLAASALAVAAFIAAWTFGANLERLVDDPDLQGFTWDVVLGEAFTAPTGDVGGLLGDPALVEGYSGVNIGRLQVTVPGTDGPSESVAAVGIDQIVGSVYPRLVDGVAATEEGEIVLGARVAQRLGVGVGDEVRAGIVGQDAAAMRVTGLAVLPGLGAGLFATTDLGEGAVVPASVTEDPTVGGPHTLYLIDLADGVDEAAALASLEDGYAALDPLCSRGLCAVTDLPPPGIRNAERLRSTPTALAVVLALLAVATLGSNLVTSVRRRRRDLAILRAVGFQRRQVAMTCAGHAVVVALLACIVGIPVGVVVGRQLWTAFSDQVGAFVDPATPAGAVVVAVPLTVAVAVVLAVVPGWMASRVDPAPVLHGE